MALGDSYTIGESVPITKRWPVLLAKSINKKGYSITDPVIIAQTGWRTDHLLKAMNKQLDDNATYDLVSVLIGVNNQFQRKSIEQYEEDLHTIFEQAIASCSSGKEGVFVLSIPDYGATPFGKNKAKTIGQAINEWNRVFKKVTQSYGLPWHDITPISRKAIEEPSLIAKDGLHPSGKMYQLWVDQITDALIANTIKK